MKKRFQEKLLAACAAVESSLRPHVDEDPRLELHVG